MKRLTTMRKALNDPLLFKPILDGETWAAWRILLIAAMGERLKDEERAIFKRLTGRSMEPSERVDELWAVIGRRGGKTRAAAVLAAYFAALCDFSDVLAPGERASVLILSQTVWQSKKALSYISGIFLHVAALNKLVFNETKETLELRNHIDIECRPANFRNVRSATCAAAICDEIAFWRSDESANPDAEILAALRPCLATTGGPLIAISSPYAKRGELYGAVRDYHGEGKDDKILVAMAHSRFTNPSLDEKVIERAFKRDPQAAASEYGTEAEGILFRSDIEAFLSREAVDAIVIPSRFELPPVFGLQYQAFVDPSGGSSDDMVLAIAHREGEVAVLDCVRVAHPPFNADAVTKQFADTLKRYGVSEVTGDRYGGEWPSQRFAAHGVTYNFSEKSASEIFQHALPLLLGKRVELLDHDKLKSQLVSLERRCSKTGKELISHPSGNYHDDVANAACGALALAAGWADEFDLDTFIKAYGNAKTIRDWDIQRNKGATLQ